MFDKFYLLTVPHGRKGVVPYEYPSAAAHAAESWSPKLPRPTDVINFCFPDLDDLRKTRSLDFKGPVSSRPQVTQIGEKMGVVGVGGPAAPPSLGGGGSITGSSSYSATSPTSGALGSDVDGGVTPGSSSIFRAEFYTFTLTEADGTLIFGVVYRCLPSGFGMRYDVGKRYPECLCLLTRYPQAQSMFRQVLQQVHALRLMFAPIARIESLLGDLYHRSLPSPGETLMLKQTPVGTEHAARAYRYIWPAEGEVPTGDALATIYLFQQLKPKSFTLLLSAMLCEHRICFISYEMDKLFACTHAAIGLLYPFSWQHVFIPVLPPSLLSYASTPSPIIFGIRRQHLPALPPSPLSDDFIYVDLDSGELSWSGSGPCPVPDFYVLPNTSQVVQEGQREGRREGEPQPPSSSSPGRQQRASSGLAAAAADDDDGEVVAEELLVELKEEEEGSLPFTSSAMGNSRSRSSRGSNSGRNSNSKGHGKAITGGITSFASIDARGGGKEGGRKEKEEGEEGGPRRVSKREALRDAFRRLNPFKRSALEEGQEGE
eukprot:evm.model.NODE_31977_length_99932_cov_29.870142.20